MEIQVLIEPIVGNGYRARNAAPFGISVEGATQEEALSRLQELMRDRLSAGVRILQVSIPGQDDPWHRLQGVYKDDPLFDKWQQAIEEYRQQVEDDPDAR